MKNGISRIGTVIIASLVGAIVLVVSAGTLIRLNRLNNEMDALRRGLQTEVESQNSLTTALEANQRTVTRHVQEVRSLLNLSPGTYRFPKSGETAEEAANDREDPDRYADDLFYRAVDRLISERERAELEAEVTPQWTESIQPALARLETPLRLQSAGRLRKQIVDGQDNVWATISVDADGATLRTLTDAKHVFTTLQDLAAELPTLLTDTADRITRFEDARREVTEFLQDRDTRAALDAHRLTAAPASANDGTYTWSFVTRDDGINRFTVVIQRHPWNITVDDTSTSTTEDALDLLSGRIDSTDPRTPEQRKVESSLNRVKEIIGSAPFQAYLDQYRLSISAEPRETLDFFMFDVRGDEADRIGSLSVQKQSGEIYLVDGDEIVITGLENAAGDPLSTIRQSSDIVSSNHDQLPEGFPPGFQGAGVSTEGTNVLLFGTHENRADTIMLLHLAPDRSISMISIPRDIWWKERKLSYHYEIYGGDVLVEEIADLVQQPIHGWISVDMYAFIEIVDVLGGIDVTLEEPLIDPTYRVRQDGEWGTLYYPAGTHHLGGVEALRLARSRHTSNDFERALRQQKILIALRDKLNALHAGDLDQLYGIVETLNRYVDSSYSVWQLTQLFLNYRNGEIANRTGLTFDNVLYNTYSNVHLQGLEIDEIEEDVPLGEWILLPRQNDWSVIPWFVAEHIK